MLIGKFSRLTVFFLVFIPNILLLSACSEVETKPGDGTTPKTYTLTVPMTAKQVVPSSESTKIASASVVADERDNSLTISVDARAFSDVDTVSLHNGFAGTNGSSIPLVLSDDPNIWIISGGFSDFSDSQFTNLLAGKYYLELTSTSYPAGEVRGQILTDNLDLAIFDINGASVHLPNSSTLTGVAYATSDNEKSSVTIFAHLSEANIILRSFLFQGSAGINGSILQGSDFKKVPTDPKIWELLQYTLEPEQLTALKEGNLYIGMHSQAFPDIPGEIRGQFPAR